MERSREREDERDAFSPKSFMKSEGKLQSEEEIQRDGERDMYTNSTQRKVRKSSSPCRGSGVYGLGLGRGGP